jgi:arginine/ornithine transport system substrate-binding protein
MKMLIVTALALSFGLAAGQASAQEKVLKIGTEAAYKPFAYIDASGQMTGFDIDITRAMCDQMKVKCEIVNQDFDGLIPALQVRKIDAVIASMFITEERKKSIDFAGPYYSTPRRFIGRKGMGLDLQPESFKGKVVGVQRGTTNANYVEQKLKGFATAKYYDTQDAANLDLAAGRVDLVVADSVVLQRFLDSKDAEGLDFVTPPISDPSIFGVGAGIGLRKGDAALKQQFDEALKALIASGKYAEINKKYLPIDIKP